MSEEIELGGILVQAVDWEATPESIKRVLEFLLEERNNTKQRLEELEEKLNKNSQNSSIPPSKNGFKAKADSKAKPKRKPLSIEAIRLKPEERKLYPVEEIDIVHEELPSICNSCGHELTGLDSQAERHQIVDLPIIKPLIIEYRLHQLECEHCGGKTRASLPLGVSLKCYGASLAAFVAYLSGECRQSHRQIQQFLSQVFRIEMARGTINRMRLEVSIAVEGATTEVQEWVQQQSVINCDETGFNQQNKDGKNPKDFKAWLWVLVTPLVSVFIVTLSRSQEVAKQLIGESFSGYLGTDRYGSYSWVKTELRQLCGSHLRE